MNNMTWLDLYNLLHKKANDIHNLDQKLWSSPVVVHDATSGDEYYCDTWLIDDPEGDDQLVLVINSESIFRETSE